jgi:hypothetical protein
MKKSILFSLALASCLLTLASCGGEDKDHKQGVIGAEKWANIGSGAIALTVADEYQGSISFKSDFSASYVTTYVGASALTIKGATYVNANRVTLSLEGKITDTQVTGFVISSDGLNGADSAYDYLSIFTVVDSPVVRGHYSSSNDRHTYSLDLLNGGSWIETALTSANITFATSDPTTYPLTSFDPSFKYDSDQKTLDVSITYSSSDSKASAACSISFTAATNSLGFAGTSTFAKL